MDLGTDPTFARQRVLELKRSGFLSRATRRVEMRFVVYNNALPMFCYVRIIFDMTETGHMSTVVMVEGMNLQEYAPPSS